MTEEVGRVFAQDRERDLAVCVQCQIARGLALPLGDLTQRFQQGLTGIEDHPQHNS